jgi:hypothetical protein
MKSNVDKKLKDIKKYLPSNDEYLNKLHSNLEQDIFSKSEIRSRNNSWGRFKFGVIAACFMMIILGSGFIINTTRTESIKNSTIVLKKDPVQTNNLVLLCSNNKFGFINLDGKVVIEPQFDYASSFNEYGVATVMNHIEGKEYYGLIGLNGLLTDINLWDIGSFQQGIAKVKSREGKYGFIDFNGKWIAEAIYDDARDFSEGMAAVAIKTNNLVGQENSTVESIGNTSDERFMWGFINDQGKVIAKTEYQKVESFSNGLAYVQEPGYWQTTENHYIDKNGEKEITLPWQWVLGGSRFKEDGTAIIQRVSENNRVITLTGVINTKGELVLPFEYRNISEATYGLRIATPNKEGPSLSGIIDATGKWVVQPNYFEMGKIKDGMVTASIIKGGRQYTGILKVDGTWLYEPKNQGVFSFKDDMVVFIENTGRDGVGVVMALYDLKGNQLLKGKKYNNIEVLSKDFIRCGTVADNSKGKVKWSIYSPEGIEFIENTNIWSAYLLPDDNIMATIHQESDVFMGVIDGKTKEWIVEPIYQKIIKYSKGIGAGIRKIEEKCTEDTIVFVLEIFDSSGKVTYITAEETMSFSKFEDISKQ